MTDDDTTPRDFAGPEAHFIPHFERRIDAIERRHDDLARMVESLDASRTAGRRILWLVIPALVGALATVLVFSAEKIASSSERAGKLEATVDALKERASKQDSEIAQLLDVLLHRGAALEPHKPTSGPDPFFHDRYGGIDPQWPKLQRPQPVCGRIWHSVLVEHTSLQDSGWMTSSIRRARSIDSGTGSRGGGSGGGATSQPTMTMATITNAMHLGIPEM